MRRYMQLILVIAAAGCSGQHFDREQALEALQTQVREAAQAGIEENHERLADLTHPELIKRAGGRAELVKQLTSMAAEMKGQGFKMTGTKWGNLPAIAAGGRKVFGVVPYTLEMSGPGGITGTQETFMLGESSDGGKTWKFLDGAGSKGDRKMVKAIMPEFPDELQLPALKPPDIKR